MQQDKDDFRKHCTQADQILWPHFEKASPAEEEGKSQWTTVTSKKEPTTTKTKKKGILVA